MGTIVVGFDGSEESSGALRWAVAEARRRQVSVEALHAWDYPYVVAAPGRSSDPQWSHRNADRYLRTLLEEALPADCGVEVRARVEEGPASRVLVDAARQAELLVIGSRGRGGFTGLLLGSVSQRCAHEVSCPVVIVRGEPEATSAAPAEGKEGRIVVGVDGSANSLAALRWALDEARLRDGAVEVVHSWESPYVVGLPYSVIDIPRAELEEGARLTLDRAIGSADVTGVRAVEPILASGSAASALLRIAKGADLVVVGSRGHGGLSRLLLGSVSQQVAHHGPCPVAIIPE